MKSGSMSGAAVGSAEAMRKVPRLRGRRKYELSVQPYPVRTASIPASTPAAGRKWNWRSGVFSSVFPKENAPPSTRVDVSGPLRKSAYSSAALTYAGRIRARRSMLW